VWNALSSSPKWKNTLLIIIYDEHGGCYDHVAPPATAVAPDDTAPQFKQGGINPFRQFGPRVPAVLVSPLIEPGTVFRAPSGSTEFDHTSVLASLRDWLFRPENGYDGPPSDWLTSKRIAAAPTFWSALTRHTPRTDKPDMEKWNPGAIAVATPGPAAQPGRASGLDLTNPIHAAVLVHDEIDRMVNVMTAANPALEIDEQAWKGLQANATAKVSAAARIEQPTPPLAI
jgi:hypothetical protein